MLLAIATDSQPESIQKYAIFAGNAKGFGCVFYNLGLLLYID